MTKQKRKNFKLTFKIRKGETRIRLFDNTTFSDAVVSLISEFGKIYHVEYANR